MDIGVVVVTYNRVEKLKKALDAYDNQICLPKYIIVVNNCSTDNTTTYLDEWQNEPSGYLRVVICTESNIGGSGGFYTGLDRALTMNSDWIWVADDDAYVDYDAFDKIQSFVQSHTEYINNVAAISGEVIAQGITDIRHRRRINKTWFKLREVDIQIQEYDNEYFEIDIFSYVGTMVKKDVLFKVGLTKKELFIFYDDTEHSIRIGKKGKLICLPSVHIIHDINETANSDIITWKVYYGFRNYMYYLHVSFKKRYYIKQKIYFLIKAKYELILGKNIEENKIILNAINDEAKGKLGLHEKYRPGWSVKL